ncbi:MAG: 30S ribosomal protein S17 [Methylococcales symbiont of Iophon sp. n. MRB-2018]|nr:MAG: 30S ribosomal protein S17 [Methylococcales symbiont of Iophon sp. n. MRB-2018]KAF3978839.1 MAG: 30S ribosomal protein S17 [Methylococcales symbiont of Iophon sp. n. MRB-2018]
MTGNKEKLRIVTGKVVSDKMDKSITVKVERLVKHPVYGKYIRRSTKYMAHDESNQAKQGDVVSITSCRPMSKNKTFKLVSILDSSD